MLFIGSLSDCCYFNHKYTRSLRVCKKQLRKSNAAIGIVLFFLKSIPKKHKYFFEIFTIIYRSVKFFTDMNTTLLTFSSITKKIVMACAGLFLVIFLLVHLGINLTLLRGDEGGWFNDASNFMSTNYLIKIFEFVLFGGFILHILVGIILTLKNWASRPVGYYKANKSKTSFFSKYMIWTGLIIFIFLAIHFMNFYFVKLGIVPVPNGAADKHDFYHMAINLFSTPLYSGIYIVLILLLGFHLYHAFQSAFQTLGLNHNKYNSTIKTIALCYALLVSLGFSIIPVYFLFFFN